ncbi:CHASE2 domain-containing protein [Pantanalinema rosaneae CENA516]|uniref:nSTAND1 domain-containing NTPase n=1 Tax=Pantanalinema rosaneae TaxID=1620701 RepID=UPI003D6F5985
MSTFEIALQRQFEDAWPIVVKIKSIDGLTTHAAGTFRLSADDFTELIELQENPEAYGILLGKRLFREEIRDTLISARSQTTGYLRVLLSLEVDKQDRLRTLHWEWLCDPVESGGWNYLALDQKLPFSQYIPTHIDRRFPPIGRRDLRALILVASPEDSQRFKLAPFNVATTIAGVQASLGKIPCDVLANHVKEAIAAPTLDNLCEQLANAQRPYTLLHIVCHGRLMTAIEGDTVLYWATASNQVEPIPAKTLLRRLYQLGGKNGLPHLIFLSTCESADPRAEGALGGLAQRLVRDLGVPAVVAMTRRISVETALTLGQRFYQRLRESGEVDLALQAATVGLASRSDVVVPALFSRLGERPLFSDRLEGRELTDAEIEFGIAEFGKLIDDRAPNATKLRESLNLQVQVLATFRGATSSPGLTQRQQALKELNYLCEQVLEISFDALAALGKEPPPYQAECPFPGLSSFAAAAYHRFFFGRDELVKSLQKELVKANFLAVLGPSGSGKSSIVLAGLIPQLQRQEPSLNLAYLTPGSEPLEQLEASQVGISGEPTVFVIDQFEELFTLCTDEAKRNEFIDRLLNLAQGQKVILTLRTDFLGECTRYRKLSQRIEERQKLIGPMTAAELGRAMKMQADQVLLEFEAGLSNAILAEVEDEPGAMPLLQYALQELWNRRRGRWLCYEEYEAIGGMQQAIATTANQFYNNLSAQEQQQIRHIFEQLTRIDEEFEPSNQDDQPRDTRRRVTVNQLVTETGDLNQTKNLIAKLANARLVITRDNEVEVAHEALIQHWPLLQRWLTESRPRLKLQQQLRSTIKRWQESQDDGELLRGGLLQTASADLEATPAAFSQDEKAFIRASQELPRRKPKLPAVLQASFAVTAFVTVIRIFGLMQPLELAAYDQMMRLKPGEAKDERLLIVAVNDQDILEQSKRNEPGVGVIKDPSLQKLLQKLQQYKPRVIGLDVLRDAPDDPSTQLDQWLKLLTAHRILVGICTSPEGTVIGQGGRYPVALSLDQIKDSIGFSNFLAGDNENNRLQPLLNPIVEDKICPTEQSFSFAIARHYLEARGISYQPPLTQEHQYTGDLKLGETPIKRRTGLTAGYQGDLSEPPTYQIFLNYRSYQGDINNFAERVSLQEVLTDKLSEQQVKDKIVMIGIDSEFSAPDVVFTAFGKRSGPIVQAQMVSQIVSAVVDQRPLIWWWPVWADILWIGIWATAGGLIVWWFHQPLHWVMGAVSLISLTGICYIIFTSQSGWIPLVPPFFALISAAGIVAFITFKLRQGNSRKKSNRAKKLVFIFPHSSKTPSS